MKQSHQLKQQKLIALHRSKTRLFWRCYLLPYCCCNGVLPSLLLYLWCRCEQVKRSVVVFIIFNFLNLSCCQVRVSFLTGLSFSILAHSIKKDCEINLEFFMRSQFKKKEITNIHRMKLVQIFKYEKIKMLYT